MSRYTIVVSHAAQLGPSNTEITGELIDSDNYGVKILTDEGEVVEIKAQHINNRRYHRPRL